MRIGALRNRREVITMTRILLLAALVFGLTFIPSASATHHKSANPASCFRKAGWTVKTNRIGGVATSSGTFFGRASASWEKVYIPGFGRFLVTSLGVTQTERATVLGCLGTLNNVPNVAP